MEEQRPAGRAEGKISQFVQDQQIEANQRLGDLACLAFGLLLFESIDQFDGREEADLSAMVLDGLDSKSGRDMRFASARATDKDNVLRPIHELASVQLAHGGLVDLAGGEVEAGDVFVRRKAGSLHMIGDGADLALGHLGLQQLG